MNKKDIEEIVIGLDILMFTCDYTNIDGAIPENEYLKIKVKEVKAMKNLGLDYFKMLSDDKYYWSELLLKL